MSSRPDAPSCPRQHRLPRRASQSAQFPSADTSDSIVLAFHREVRYEKLPTLPPSSSHLPPRHENTTARCPMVRLPNPSPPVRLAADRPECDSDFFHPTGPSKDLGRRRPSCPCKEMRNAHTIQPPLMQNWGSEKRIGRYSQVAGALRAVDFTRPAGEVKAEAPTAAARRATVRSISPTKLSNSSLFAISELGTEPEAKSWSLWRPVMRHEILAVLAGKFCYEFRPSTYHASSCSPGMRGRFGLGVHRPRWLHEDHCPQVRRLQ